MSLPKILTFSSTAEANEELLIGNSLRVESVIFDDSVYFGVEEVIEYIRSENGGHLQAVVTCGSAVKSGRKPSLTDGLRIAKKAKERGIPSIAIYSSTEPTESENKSIQDLDIHFILRKLYGESQEELQSWIQSCLTEKVEQ